MQEDATVSHPLVTLEHPRNTRLARFSFVFVVEDQ